jgi:hypothetical protein
MGQAKQRGTFEERKAQAIAAERVKGEQPFKPSGLSVRPEGKSRLAVNMLTAAVATALFSGRRT